MKETRATLLALITLALSSHSCAAIVIEYSQVGPGVVFNYSGSYGVNSSQNGFFEGAEIVGNFQGDADADQFRNFRPAGYGVIGNNVTFTGSGSNWAPGIGAYSLARQARAIHSL